MLVLSLSVLSLSKDPLSHQGRGLGEGEPRAQPETVDAELNRAGPGQGRQLRR